MTARELQAAVEAELAALPEASRLALPLAVVAARRLALVAAGGAPATTVAALRQLRVELDRLASYAARGRTE